MTWEQISGFVRHLLTFGAGYLVSAGIFDSAQVDILVASVLGLIGLAWSYFTKPKPVPTPPVV